MKGNARDRYLPVVMFPAIMPIILLPGMKADLSPYLFYGMWGFSLGLAVIAVAWMAKGTPRQSARRETSASQG